MEVRVLVQVSGVKIVFKFIMSRGSGLSLRKCNMSKFLVGDLSDLTASKISSISKICINGKRLNLVL